MIQPPLLEGSSDGVGDTFKSRCVGGLYCIELGPHPGGLSAFLQGVAVRLKRLEKLSRPVSHTIQGRTSPVRGCCL